MIEVPPARIPEEPGAVIPHAGIGKGGVAGNRRPYLNRYKNMALSPDKIKFEQWSGHGCGNSDYSFVRTICCNQICVEDNELHQFFFDPNDPSAHSNLWEDGLNCPICGNHDWEISDRLEDLEGSEFEVWPTLGNPKQRAAPSNGG